MGRVCKSIAKRRFLEEEKEETQLILAMLAIIEFSPSHDECLWSWKCLAEQTGFQVLYFVHPSIAKRASLILPGAQVFPLELPEKASGRFHFLLQLKKQLKSLGIRKVLFNTATGSLVRDFLLIAGKRFQFTGVLHNAEKLKGSFSQAAISHWVRHYIVLSDHVKEHVKKSTNVKLEAIYPVYFPDNLTRFPKSEKGFRVVIPGQLELARRDYPALIKSLSSIMLPEDFKLVFLGKSRHAHGSRAEIDLLLASSGLTSHAVLFDDFVDDQTFYQELRQASLILPLVHPGSEHYESYFRFQVTGSWNLAFGFKIPLLMHRSFEGYSVFRETSLFYSREELGKHLMDFYKEPWRLENASARISACQTFDLEEQAVRFREIVRY